MESAVSRSLEHRAVIDRLPSRKQFRRDVIKGLNREQKTLPCKYLYDARGSRLFDEICEVPEYYLTRTELAIMDEEAHNIASEIGPEAVLIEYGSGSSLKTRMLLDALDDPVAYVPVDISQTHLSQSAAAIAEEYPAINVVPVCADFTKPFELPYELSHYDRRVVYFPGSTIGNLTPRRTCKLLRQIRDLTGDAGGLLVGFDLQKDRDLLEAAYDDAAGVTSEFSLNLLQRINRELSGDFELDQFRHQATYNDVAGRIEIELVSQCEQSVEVSGRSFTFDAGESILTEYSHKYTVEGLQSLAARSDFGVSRVWTDDRNWFGVAYLTADNS